MFFVLLIGLGCVKQSEMITGIVSSSNECAYISVKKEGERRGLIFTTRDSLDVSESLYYCCPDKKGRPMCKKATWEPLPELDLLISNSHYPEPSYSGKMTSYSNNKPETLCNPNNDLIKKYDVYVEFIKNNSIEKIMNETCLSYGESKREKEKYSK